MMIIGPFRAVLAVVAAAFPVAAGAACLERTDMHALQAASLQQRLMVAGFTCHDAAAYNRFVTAHRGELQKSDAALMAYFKRNGGTSAYHSYKTHLANAAALESSRSDGFCGDVAALFRDVSGGGSLDAILDQIPTADTGRSACYVTEARRSRSAHRDTRVADAAPPEADRRARDDDARYADDDRPSDDMAYPRASDRRMAQRHHRTARWRDEPPPGYARDDDERRSDRGRDEDDYGDEPYDPRWDGPADDARDW